MDDTIWRLLLIAAVLAAAAVVALLFRRRPVHPPLDIAGTDLGPGLVVFTSTECQRCKVVLAAAKSVNAPLREVTYELEPGLQVKVGVTGVPLTIVVDDSGAIVAQFAGLVSAGRLRRAVAGTR
ncbi:MAG: hypothetical protein QNJ81_14045 [Acidimicrobiia bacterium]|nr:hypothetical protein [Acidimicrobiia bacterium]